MSVLEISHRSKPFDEILHGAHEDMRAIAGIPDNYRVLFLQGGASLQFSMVPMNLLTPGLTADYIVTGDWGKRRSRKRRRWEPRRWRLQRKTGTSSASPRSLNCGSRRARRTSI
jgi:phosphoserine aminotransferase